MKPDSVLGYTAMVGNKVPHQTYYDVCSNLDLTSPFQGFDPLNLAGEGADETKLNGYREAGMCSASLVRC